MDLVTKPTCMTKIILGKDGKKTEKHYLTLDPSYSVLLNISWKDNTNKWWDNLVNLYQSMFLVNKLFLWMKLYHLSMEESLVNNLFIWMKSYHLSTKDDDYIMNLLNAFNNFVIQVEYVDIKMKEENKFVTFFAILLE